MTLDTLDINHAAVVKRLAGSAESNQLMGKLAEMGLYPGKEVKVLYKAPFGDPIAVDVGGYVLSLRKYEASLVQVD